MKTKILLFKTLFLIVMLLPYYSVRAQVVVGVDEAPEKAALLQLKDKALAAPGEANADKGGFLLPRVNLELRTELYPFIRSGNAADPDSDAAYAAQKLPHRGLIVYNMSEIPEEDLHPGLYIWSGSEWKKLTEEMEGAIFDPVTCVDITVNGDYVQDQPVTEENFLTIIVNVRKSGKYNISASSGNGYSFYVNGVLLESGIQEVNIPCQGKPKNHGTDKLLVRGIALDEGCEPEVKVVPGIATYSINCSRVKVNGQYMKSKALEASNTITLSVTVSKEGSYTIATPLTRGVRFRASGEFPTKGTHTVTLQGTGTPSIITDFPIEIKTNTLGGTDACTAVVPITLPDMTYAIIGNTAAWSWGNSRRKKALTVSSDNPSFGPEGDLRISSFTELWMENNANRAADYLANNTEKPDVVLYNAYSASANDALIAALNDYINAGGCVIYGSEDGEVDDVNALMQGIFGIQPAIAQSGGASNDDVYQIKKMPDDPVVNGPFGDLSGKYWGEDNATDQSVIITELPPNSVQICSAQSESKTDQNSDYSIVWYNDSKNFFYFGDSTGSNKSSSTSAYPSQYDDNGTPISKQYGPSDNGGQYRRFVYNSALEMNAVNWAIKKAAVNGINNY